MLYDKLSGWTVGIVCIIKRSDDPKHMIIGGKIL